MNTHLHGRRLLSLLVVPCFLLEHAVPNDDEIQILTTSGSFNPTPIPIVAFFGSELTIQLQLSGDHDSLHGKNVIYALFQKVGKKTIPLGDTVKGGTVELSKTGTLISTLKVEIPLLSGAARLALKAQVEDTNLGTVINFSARPDDILARLASRQVRFTETDFLKKAFLQRGLEGPETPLKKLESEVDWKGLWFVGDSHPNHRESLRLPERLRPDQIIVLLKKDNRRYPYTVAMQRGDGWILHLDRSWFEQFASNAGLQLTLFNIINQLPRP